MRRCGTITSVRTRKGCDVVRKTLPVIQMLTMGLTCVVGEQKKPLVCEGTAIPAKGDGEMHVSSETRCIEIVGDCHGEAKLIGKWKMAMGGT